jgi:hypothetical protein
LSIAQFFNEALRFGSRLCFFLETKIAPNLVDPLHSAILSDWARGWKQSQLPKRGTSLKIVQGTSPRKGAYVSVLSYTSTSPHVWCSWEQRAKGGIDTLSPLLLRLPLVFGFHSLP